MSCLTKISLFFLVLTILCNPTFSDILSECMGSVHEVFKEDVSPVKHFKIALYSLSKKLILSKNGTQEYMTFYEQNAGVISEFGPFFAGKHDETLTYFRLLERLVSPINLPPESKRSYVLGYFNLLIDHFYNSDPSMNNIPSVDNSIIEFNKTTVNNYVITPERYCIGRGIFEPSCREALTRMLRDPQQPDNDPSNMDGYQILKYCYKKLTHLDFTLEKYYLANVIDAVDIPFYKIQLQTMASYLAYISDMAESIVDHCVDNDIFSECMGSIHEVFNGDVPSTYHFKLALYSISEKLILSMNDTQDYIRYYEDNVQAIPEFIGRQILYKRHNKTLEYFRSLIQWLVSPISNAHFNLPPESKRPYVLGYFNLLINQFDNPNLPLDIKAMINYHVHTPEKYCINRGINVALYMMLLDPDQPNNEPANMDGYQILKYCYKTFTHLDFTLEKYYPETFDAGNGASYYQRNQLATMASYLAYVLDMTEQAVDEIINYGFQFPTILELCTARSST